MEAWIETVSGVHFEFLDPKPEQIRIHDIAHALGNNCRFVGQCRKFYSVAEHSWHVARMLEGAPLEVQLAGLLHDASEAYITDMASPVKQFMPEYRAMEDKVMIAIAAKYGFEYPLHEAVKYADMMALSIEAHHLLLSKGNDWDMWRSLKRPPIIDSYRPIGMVPETARQVFLDKFFELSMKIRGEEKQEA
jgi:uncharacterized protein